MTRRINKTSLNNQVDEINRIVAIVERNCVGSYELDIAYGGYLLHKIVTPSGGARDIFSKGHVPARKLYDLMDAFILGLNSKAI